MQEPIPLTSYISRELKTSLVALAYGSKTPVRNNYEDDPGYRGDQPLTDHRSVFHDVDSLTCYLAHNPARNWGVLGLFSIDNDSDEATAWTRDMGIKSSDAYWILRTRRGYKPIGRAPANCPPTSNDPTHRRGELTGPKSLIVIQGVHPKDHNFQYRFVRGHSPLDIPITELAEPPEAIMSYWRSVSDPPRPPRTYAGTSANLGNLFDVVVDRLNADGANLRPISGGYLKGNCIFHNSDGKKSFTVHPEKGAHCFAGCLKNGRLTSLALRLGIGGI